MELLGVHLKDPFAAWQIQMQHDGTPVPFVHPLSQVARRVSKGNAAQRDPPHTDMWAHPVGIDVLKGCDGAPKHHQNPEENTKSKEAIHLARAAAALKSRPIQAARLYAARRGSAAGRAEIGPIEAAVN
jgi:hypothetical protein